MMKLLCLCMITIYYGVLAGGKKGQYYLVETKGNNNNVINMDIGYDRNRIIRPELEPEFRFRLKEPELAFSNSGSCLKEPELAYSNSGTNRI